MDLRYIEGVLLHTTTSAACQLRNRLMEVHGAIESTVKVSDDTRVTPIDLAIEQTIGDRLKARLGGEPVDAIIGEEGTVIGNYEDAGLVVFFDPTDGTALVRLVAPGSTTGSCLYDRSTQRFLAGVVADPWLHRVVYTKDGVTYRRRFDVDSGLPLGDPIACRVSNKSFADGGELLIEVAHGFTRNVFDGEGERRRVFNQDGITRLWSSVHTRLKTKARMCSSNLMHQLLVASGGDAIATVMSAIGGPWDMSGVALVKGAGGSVVYVRRDHHGDFQPIDDPMQADLVISANSKATAEEVYATLLAVDY